jgi:hypothetical protein
MDDGWGEGGDGEKKGRENLVAEAWADPSRIVASVYRCMVANQHQSEEEERGYDHLSGFDFDGLAKPMWEWCGEAGKGLAG